MSKNIKHKISQQGVLPLGEHNSDAKTLPPATTLMKTVASRSPNLKNMKKNFSDKEIAEILNKNSSLENASEEKVALKEQYRKIKRRVKEMEVGNQSRLIVFPSLTNGEGWYKVVEFSALYYVYRLADRMGRGARVYKDSDKFSKCLYSATFQNIEKFIEQFEYFEGSKPELTSDGIYLFNLKKPLSDDEVGMLRRTEETRREKLHNILRPKAMDPAVFQAILMVARQIIPRIRKLEKQYYYTIGEDMVKDVKLLLSIYYNFANGLINKKDAAAELLRVIDNLFSGLTILAEIRIWPYDVSAVIGENINEVKRLIIKNFGLKVE